MRLAAVPTILAGFLAVTTCLAALTPNLKPRTSSPGWSAINLLPTHGVVLKRDNSFDTSAFESCTTDDLTGLTFDGIAHPIRGAAWTIAMQVSNVVSQSSDGVLLATPKWSLSWDTQQGIAILKDNVQGGTAFYSMRAPGTSPLSISLAVKANGDLQFCNGNGALQPFKVQSTARTLKTGSWVAYTALNLQAAGLDISIGDRVNGVPTSCQVLDLWAASGAIDCGASTALAQIQAATALSKKEPTISGITRTPGNVFVGDSVSLSATATYPDSNSLMVRATMYGVPTAGCATRSCGDVTRNSSGTGTASVSVSGTYKRPGRFLIRVEASDGLGNIITQDHEVLVRKIGDTTGKAPCCRYTPNLLAQQFGRPLHLTSFRDPLAYSLASGLGWTKDYMDNEDMEAERLFDFGILAPTPAGPLSTTSCADLRLAGGDSPKVIGLFSNQSPINMGHNKRLLVVPQGYSWANDAGVIQPVCAEHWSGWQSTSPDHSIAGYDATGMPSKYCSYSCTSYGVDFSNNITGFLERLAEAVVDNSYGRVSLSWDIDILPTLYLPYQSNADSAFAYHQNPTLDYLSAKGINPERDYHTVMVLAPWAKHMNQGYLAWSGGGQSPYIFVLKCNPQHYYALHEIGHRFGLAHSSIYRLDSATTAPTNPLSSGVIEDSYSDKLDMMACCRSDFNLHGRILAGWVPGAERDHLTLNNATSTTPATYRYTLWPFDRTESRGKLKGVSVRIAADKLLLLGFRSLPGWQDVRVSRYPNDNSDGALSPDEMRHTTRGLSVEYLKRFYENGGQTPTWTQRGLIDFNVLFALYPKSLPQSAGSYAPDPEKSAYALLKEGFAWVSQENRLLIMAESIGPCDSQAEVPVYNYSARAFYGARGELPGYEFHEQGDYTGYQQLECMKLVVKTGFTSNPGMLDVKVVLAEVGSDNQVPLASGCGFRLLPRLKLVLPGGVQPLSVVWTDPLNRPFARGSLTVDLPPMPSLKEFAAQGAGTCNSGCPEAYSVKVVGPEGEQTKVDITVKEVSIDRYSIRSKYTYFMLEAITNRYETLYGGIARSIPSSSTAPQGVSVLSQAVKVTEAATVLPASSIPSTACSKQWTISLTIKVITMPAGASVLVMAAAADGNIAKAQPALYLRRSENGASSIGVSFAGQLEQTMSISSLLTNGYGTIQVTVIRDDSRLGIWVGGGQIGGWVLQDVWCAPSRQTVTYCDKQPVGSGFAFPGVRFGGASTVANVEVSAAKVYNYAIPPNPTALAAEGSCIANKACGAFLVQGYAVPGPTSVPASEVSSTTVVPTTQSSATASTAPFVQVGGWGPCTLPCGGGTSTRTVQCLKPDGTQVALSQCPQDQIPVTTMACNTVSCPSASLIVVEPPASACSTGCGTGSASMVAMCRSSLGTSLRLQDCTPLTAYPSTSVPAASFSLFSSADLAAALAQGKLLSTCSGPTCGRYQLQISTWGACNVTCGGGVRSRSYKCVDTASGAVSDNSNCADQLARTNLVAACNTQPCNLYAWTVGPWGLCSGELGIGSQLRSVICTNSTSSTTIDVSFCTGPKPSAEEMCIKTAHKSGLCIPVNYPVTTKDCFGNGTCTQTGCACNSGYSGQYCEVAPSCNGVMAQDRSCCASGVLAVDGTCCAASSVLDKDGKCCGKKLDACGVCGGTAVSVDLQGKCCSGPLDQSGSCCTSGKIDECGVCDGDGLSCAALITVQASVGTTDTTYTNTIKQQLASALALSTKAILFLTQTTGIAAPTSGFSATEVTTPIPTTSSTSSASYRTIPTALIEQPTSDPIPIPAPTPTPTPTTTPTTSIHPTILTSVATRPTTCPFDPTADIIRVPSYAWTPSKITRRLQATVVTQLAASNAANTKLMAVTYRIVLPPGSTNVKGLPFTLGGIYAAVAPLLSTTGTVNLTAVSQVDRVGICGNGICETGEQSISLPVDSITGGVGATVVSTSSCTEDCPLSISMCGAPRGLGDPKKECGGNGRCLRSSGRCDCYNGYVGETCGECQAGWYNRGGHCVPQYINGQTVFDHIPQTIEGITAPVRQTKKSPMGGKVGPLPMMALVGVGAGVVALIAVAGLFALWWFRWRTVAAKPLPPTKISKDTRPSGDGAADETAVQEFEAGKWSWRGGWPSQANLWGSVNLDKLPSHDPRKASLLMEAIEPSGSSRSKPYIVHPPGTAVPPEMPHLQRIRTGAKGHKLEPALSLGAPAGRAYSATQHNTPSASTQARQDDAFI